MTRLLPLFPPRVRFHPTHAKEEITLIEYQMKPCSIDGQKRSLQSSVSTSIAQMIERNETFA